MAGDTYVKKVNSNSNLLKDLSATMVEIKDFMATDYARDSLDDEALETIRDNLLVLNEKLRELKYLNRIEEHNKRFGKQLLLSSDDETIFELKDNLEVLSKKLKFTGNKGGKDANGKYVKKDY
jgi:hypothetical protein